MNPINDDAASVESGAIDGMVRSGNGANDIAFLNELRGRVQDGFNRRDVGQIEYALKMIDDWIDELTTNI